MKEKRVRHLKKKQIGVFDEEYPYRLSLEERKTLEYLSNLINSRYINNARELFNFTEEVIGLETTILLLKKYSPGIAKDVKNHKISNSLWTEESSRKTLINFLKSKVVPYIKRRIKGHPSSQDSDFERRLKLLKKSFNLTKIETEILAFFYLLTTCGLENVCLCTKITDLDRFSTFRNYGHSILGLNRELFLRTVLRNRLFKAYILNLNFNRIELASWCLDYLSGYGTEDLLHEFFINENEEYLQLSDFNISENEKIVLETLIKSKDKQNILFYGVPGTGKSSFARSLAKTYKKELFTVKASKTDKHKDRLLAISATINLAEKSNTIVLVDEADEVLNTHSSFSFRSTTNKSYINNLLDDHQKKVIWITNRSSGIDSSAMRRFTFSVEFKKFNAKDRLNVLNKELKRQKLDNYFNGDDLHDLCRMYSVNAGGIIDAINILRIGKRSSKETALRKVKTILKNHEKVTTRIGNHKTSAGEFNNYSLSGLNTSHDMENIVSVVRQYSERQNMDSDNFHSVKMLLYGIPGTGKSNFVHYLGNLLNREVLLKRCSAIRSKWVGETEKNIAEAFSESQTSNSILFFDEADSLLYPRKEARNSWEKSMTNEILTQMDSYSGIVVFATNDVAGLDHAAFRRFQFKIEFLPLTAEGNIQFYNSIFSPLIRKDQELSENDVIKIQNIKNLTPGDFAVVKEQYAFTNQSNVTHQQLIEALMNETRHKESGNRIAGFSVR